MDNPRGLREISILFFFERRKYEKTIQNIRCAFFISNATFVSADVRIVSAAAIESGSVNADTVAVPDNGESSDDNDGLGVQPSKPEIEYEGEPELQEKPIEPEESDQSSDEQSGKSGTDLEIQIPPVMPVEPDKSKITEPPSYDLFPEMSDEELQYLIDVAADKQNSIPPAEEEFQTFSTFSTFSTRGYSLVNELENVYKYGSNIASQIADIFSMLPVTGKELRQQLAEVSEFVIRQDKWIVVRIDALAGVVAEHNTRLQNQLAKINENWDYHQKRVNEVWDVLSPRIAALDTRVTGINNTLVAKDSALSAKDAEHFDYFQNRINESWTSIRLNRSDIDSHFDYHKSRVNEVWDKIPKTVTALDTRLTNINSALVAKDSEHFDYFQGRVNEAWTSITANRADINEHFDYQKERVNEIWDKIPKTVTALDNRLTGINNVLTAADTALRDKDSEHFDYFQSRVNEVWTNLSSKTTEEQVKSLILKDKDIIDTRWKVSSPDEYIRTYPKQTVRELKHTTTLLIPGVSDGYGVLITEVPYDHYSGGNIKQVFYSNDSQFIRFGTGVTWSAWDKQATVSYVDAEIKIVMDQINLINKSVSDNRSKILGTDAAVTANKIATDKSFADVNKRVDNSNLAIAARTTEEQVKSLILKDKDIIDSRWKVITPDEYIRTYPKQTVRELKHTTTLLIPGVSDGYGVLITEVPYDHYSGGNIKQVFYSNDSQFIRFGTGVTWSAWDKQATVSYVDAEIKIVMDQINLINKSVSDNRSKILGTDAAVTANKIATDNSIKDTNARINLNQTLIADLSSNIKQVSDKTDNNRTLILATDAAVIANKLSTDKSIKDVDEKVKLNQDLIAGLSSNLKDVSDKTDNNRTLILATDAAVIANKFATDNRIAAVEETLAGLHNYDDFELRKEFRRFDANSDTLEIKDGDGSFTKLMKFLTNYTVLTLEIEGLKLRNVLQENHVLLLQKLSIVVDYFDTTVDWLKMIYDKPVSIPSITVPEFNYEWLEEMIDGISFGNVVNEAGTNIWDVMDSLVDGLSELLKSIVEIVPNLIEQIIKLFVPEDPEFFSKKFEGISTKFDSKFKPILNMGESVKGVFGSSKALTGFTVVLFGQQIDLIPQVLLDHLPTIRAYATGFLYLFTLAAVYKRFVGEGDVIS